MLFVFRKPNIFSRLLMILGIALVIIGLLLANINQTVSGDPAGMVTICHAAGLDGTTQYVTLTLNANAVYGQSGHFKEPGTPNAGHEDDYEGPCEGDEEDELITICYMDQTLEVNMDELDEYAGYEEGECDTSENITICYEGDTLEIDESELDNYPGYTEGQCSVPDLVTICYEGNSLEVEQSELDNYPGYSLGSCVLPETISICYLGVRMTVLVEELDQYPGYSVTKCEVDDEDPGDDPEDEKEVEPLPIPVVTASNVLIPVTGSDLSDKLFGNFKTNGLIGLGLILSGFGIAHKGSKKEEN